MQQAQARIIHDAAMNLAREIDRQAMELFMQVYS